MSRFNDRANEQLTLLYRRYSGWLKRVVGHRFAGDDAEEIVQKTYLRISRLVREDVVVHPRALLLRVARNTAIDRARRSGRGVLAARVDPDDERELFERSRQAEDLLLKQIVLTMPVAYVFVLSRFAGLTYDEIALRLNLSVMTLEWRMSKALLHCKHMLRTEDQSGPYRAVRVRGRPQTPHHARWRAALRAEQPAIILVDKDPALRSALEFSFRLDGFQVEPFESAEALLAGALPTAGCLVVDYDLPGMNGLQLIDQLRTRAAELPAVLIGTQPTRAVRVAAAAAGVPIVEKPLMSDTLLTTVQRMLGDHALVEPGGRDLAGLESMGDGSGRRPPLPPKTCPPFSASRWRTDR